MQLRDPCPIKFRSSLQRIYSNPTTRDIDTLLDLFLDATDETKTSFPARDSLAQTAPPKREEIISFSFFPLPTTLLDQLKATNPTTHSSAGFFVGSYQSEFILVSSFEMSRKLTLWTHSDQTLPLSNDGLDARTGRI